MADPMQRIALSSMIGSRLAPTRLWRTIRATADGRERPKRSAYSQTLSKRA